MQGKKWCVIHANCQGDQLAGLLGAHPEFGREHDIKVYVNYAGQDVPDEELANCSVFLHQHLGPEWGELSSESMRSRLGRKSRAICVPNLYFRGYWPLCDSATESDYSDRFLNELIDRGLDKGEIAQIYLNADLSRYYDVERLMEESLEHERRKEKHWDVKLTDLVSKRWQKERLFTTVNHPGRTLGIAAVQVVLGLLGYRPLPGRACRNLPDPYPNFEQPIHPWVIDRFNLEFASPDDTWSIHGLHRTFAEYVSYYVDCRRKGLKGFSD